MGEVKPRIGLPRMHLETGERRVFLPEFVAALQDMGFDVVLEKDYGISINLEEWDYSRLAQDVKFADPEMVYAQDYVLILRYPGDEIVQKLQPGICLISMLHFPTRPQRVELLSSKNLRAISLDTIINDSKRRMVENLPSVAWNGIRVSINELSQVYPKPGFAHPNRPPIQATLLGAGAVGQHVIQAAVAYGDLNMRERLYKLGVPGVLVQVVDYDLTKHAEIMQRLFTVTDILVDATQRPNPSRPVIPNAWIAWLPEHAIITDLSVDPYLLDDSPPVVRGIEGIPQGNLDKYVFKSDDPDWDLTVPQSIESAERRTVVSCYSWPGIYPKACMQHYAEQLAPLIKRLVRKGYDGISLQGDFFERALYRGTLRHFLQSHG